MAIELKIKDQYNLSEHSYVFLSLIYAFILTEFVKSFKNIHYATKEIESCFLVSLTYAWLLYFLLFTLQSWWLPLRTTKVKIL